MNLNPPWSAVRKAVYIDILFRIRSVTLPPDLTSEKGFAQPKNPTIMVHRTLYNCCPRWQPAYLYILSRLTTPNWTRRHRSRVTGPFVHVLGIVPVAIMITIVNVIVTCFLLPLTCFFLLSYFQYGKWTQCVEDTYLIAPITSQKVWR